MIDLSKYNYQKYLKSQIYGKNIIIIFLLSFISMIFLFLVFMDLFNILFNKGLYSSSLIDDIFKENIFNPYHFKTFISSYFIFYFLIISLYVFFKVIKLKNNLLIYNIGRNDNFNKDYLILSFKMILVYSLTIYIAFLAIILLQTLITLFKYHTFCLINSDYTMYYNYIDLNIYNISPSLYSFVLVFIPALISQLLLFFYLIIFYKLSNNKIYTVLFALILYIASIIIAVSFNSNIEMFIPIFPMMNITFSTSQIISWISIIIQLIIILIIIKINKGINKI
ncbi:MAG: hypothetical protein LBR40_00800 [Bacilli bacterium]|jgi:hypothetical protein|nr:hypothetical protein [Bacilli bacterium]